MSNATQNRSTAGQNGNLNETVNCNSVELISISIDWSNNSISEGLFIGCGNWIGTTHTHINWNRKSCLWSRKWEIDWNGKWDYGSTSVMTVSDCIVHDMHSSTNTLMTMRWKWYRNYHDPIHEYPKSVLWSFRIEIKINPNFSTEGSFVGQWTAWGIQKQSLELASTTQKICENGSSVHIEPCVWRIFRMGNISLHRLEWVTLSSIFLLFNVQYSIRIQNPQ